MSKLITHLRVQISSTWKDKNKAKLIKLQRKALNLKLIKMNVAQKIKKLKSGDLNEGMEVKKRKKKT